MCDRSKYSFDTLRSQRVVSNEYLVISNILGIFVNINFVLTNTFSYANDFKYKLILRQSKLYRIPAISNIC